MRGPASHQPDKPKTISDIRLGDWYLKGYTLRAMCPKCSAERQVPPKSVIDFFGPEHHWNEGYDNERIAEVLRCGTCKVKGKAAVRVARE